MVNEEIIGLVYAVAALFSFGLSPLFYKIGMKNNLHVLEANTIRSWGALALLTPILIIYRVSPCIPWELVMFVIFSALAGPIIGDTFFLFSIKKVGASVATPLVSTYSLMVAIMSVMLFGEKLTVLNILGGFLILSSVWLVYLERRNLGDESILGLIACLGAALGYALSIISMNYLLNSEVDPVAIIYLRTLLVGIMLTLLTKVLNLNINFLSKNRGTLVILSIGGFFGIGFGVIMMLNAITYLGAGKASFIASASPVVSTSLAITLLREKFRVRIVLAAILVFIGATMLK
mgnify:FL=1